MADFEAAKAFISQEVDGASVHDHLTEVLLKILTEKRADALDSFEHISASVKRARAQPARALDGEAADKEPMSTSSVRTCLGRRALRSPAAHAVAEGRADEMGRSQRRAVQGLSLYRFCRALGRSRMGRQAGDEDAGAAVQDLVHEMDVLEWAGVGIGREECFRLFLSMKKLAASAEVSHLRFWGKLLGRNADYFVVEGEAKDDEEEGACPLACGRRTPSGALQSHSARTCVRAQRTARQWKAPLVPTSTRTGCATTVRTRARLTRSPPH